MLQEALKLDPDYADAQRVLKSIKRATEMKEQATQLFKQGKLQEAVAQYQDCLGIDPLNANYNATILYNQGVILAKMKKEEEALNSLNKCLELNEDYAKAYIKRGEVNQSLGYHEDAVRDYHRANELDPSKIIRSLILFRWLWRSGSPARSSAEGEGELEEGLLQNPRRRQERKPGRHKEGLQETGSQMAPRQER